MGMPPEWRSHSSLEKHRPRPAGLRLFEYAAVPTRSDRARLLQASASVRLGGMVVIVPLVLSWMSQPRSCTW